MVSTYNGSSRFRCRFLIRLSVLLVASRMLFSAADSSLAIVDAGVQQSEDAPFVPSDYQFMPGDYLYFTFQIAGFATKSENRDLIRKISLSYTVTPEDSNGVALVEPSLGTVEAELNPEDKNWTPKRRAAFLLPSFVPSGDFHVHVVVKDLFADKETSKDFPFRIGGVIIHPTTGLNVQDFQFLRKENDREALQVPAYSPGDSVYARFNMVGFKTDDKNKYHLAYGITVLGPDGKVYIKEPKAAELEKSTFYPARYLPGVISLTTSPTSQRGEYVLMLTVNDLMANHTYQLKTAFSIE